MPMGPEKEGTEPLGEFEQRVERLRHEIEGGIVGDALALADPREGFSVVSLMEAAGDDRTFRELSKEEQAIIWQVLEQSRRTIGEDVIIEQ